MTTHLPYKKLLALVTLPGALLLCNCGNGSDNTGDGGTGGAGGGGSTFQCGSGSVATQCSLDNEICVIQDSAGPTTTRCEPIPSSCTSGDLCSCSDLKPGCSLGDGPGAFTCSEAASGGFTVECPG